MTSVKDQAGCGSCVAFGTLGAFEAVIRLNGGPYYDLSESDLFYCGCGSCCSVGWYISSAVTYLYNQGVPVEQCFPYRDYNIPCDPCDEREELIEKPVDFGYLSDASSIKSAIYNYGPVITAFAVYTDFFGYDGNVYHYTAYCDFSKCCSCTHGDGASCCGNSLDHGVDAPFWCRF